MSDVRKALGYEGPKSFKKPFGKAMSVAATLGMDVSEHFHHTRRVVDGVEIDDCKLSRVACYLVAMNCDPTTYPAVARAQVYFAAMAEIARQAIEHAENVERVLLRDDMAGAEKSLSATAAGAGVINFAFFRDKGYIGLYNMRLSAILAKKGLTPDATLNDFMGREELAANWFRVTQTEAKIRRENVRGQTSLEHAAYTVGREVRESIERVGGDMPENLPAAENISQVRSKLKKAARELQKIDKKKLPPKSKG